MKYALFFIVTLFLSQSFLSEQLRYKRVRDARDTKDVVLRSAFEKQGLTYPPKEIFLRAFKAEGELELWVKENENYELFKTYVIVTKSGELGPKTQQGDLQVPEGFYHIDRYNPSSLFHLSLGINYPNSVDKKSNPGLNWGGDIFIHGSDVTIGCLPMTDGIIKEIYWLAVQSKNASSRKTPVHIYPYRMNAMNKVYYELAYYNDSVLKEFWASLQPAYDYFEENSSLPVVKISQAGRYYIE